MPSSFVFLLDGLNNTDNINNEVLLVVQCDHNRNDEKVHTWSTSKVGPQSVTAQGLFEVLESRLQGLGI